MAHGGTNARLPPPRRTPDMKWAVLSMDVEDWYHLDYFDRRQCDLSRSLLDGLEVYAEFLRERNLPSSFFVLGELAESLELVADAGVGWRCDQLARLGSPPPPAPDSGRVPSRRPTQPGGPRGGDRAGRPGLPGALLQPGSDASGGARGGGLRLRFQPDRIRRPSLVRDHRHGGISRRRTPGCFAAVASSNSKSAPSRCSAGACRSPEADTCACSPGP